VRTGLEQEFIEFLPDRDIVLKYEEYFAYMFRSLGLIIVAEFAALAALAVAVAAVATFAH